MSDRAITGIRFTAPAIEDLVRLKKRHHTVLTLVFKKLQYLSANPGAGLRLSGDLSEFKKVTVGNRAWRIVYKERLSADGLILEIAEIWGIGARSESAIYEEVRQRIKEIPAGPLTVSLYDVLLMLQEPKFSLATPATSPREPVPAALRSRLMTEMGLSDSSLIGMSATEALELWEHHIRG